MELIKSNLEKQRAVYKIDATTIRKQWFNKTYEWANDHAGILNKLNPGYVKMLGGEAGAPWIEFKLIEGQTAQVFEHTQEWIRTVHNFCHEHYKQTSPYAHGDWVLSNIIVNNNKLYLVDWDNVGIGEPEDVYAKIYSDLKSAFGDAYDEMLRTLA